MGITFEEAAAAHHSGDFATAERGYLAFPTSRNAVYNLATLYRHTGRLDEAVAAYRLIASQYPDIASARRCLAVCLLALREYAAAWPLYEARREEAGAVVPAANFPEWAGESLAGRRVVVVPEQGFGDQLMFARYLRELEARGAEVVAACSPRHLARLFERCGFRTFPYWRAEQKLPAADYWAIGNSLPLKLGLEAPASPAYFPTSELARGGGVGIVATGNPDHYNDRNRSLGPRDAAALLELGRDLSPAATGALDFLDTADIIAGLDLVVTVDTSVAHLAGSMGKPCWVLLPALGMDWRWNDGLRSDWYPAARLFRQAAAGDWASVIAAVRLALATERARAEADA
jgi:hypothetical protein